MREPDLDVSELQWPTKAATSKEAKPSRIPRHRTGEKFLKGPIPLDWLSQAMKLPGKALHIADILWIYSGIKRSAEIPLSLSRLKEFGITRTYAARALKSLEGAGLITVDRKQGRKAVVKLLPGTRSNESADDSLEDEQK